MKEYCFKVCFGDGRYADGTYDVVAVDEDEATDIALSEICEKLYKALPDLNIEVSVELDEERIDEDDNDFLQDLIDEADIEATIEIWLGALLKATGKTTTDELTVEEIRAEIEEVQGTISNERVWALSDDIHYENIEQLSAYLKVLEEMLNDKEISQ